MTEIRIKPPRQARSKKTLEALLDAAEALLADRSFAEMRIDEIVAMAGSSSGSFYARFEDKTALLHALHQRFLERSVHELNQQLGTSNRPDREADLAFFVVKMITERHEANIGILRAALMESFHDEGFALRAYEFLMQVVGLVATRFAHDYKMTESEELKDQVEFALQLVLAILDQRLFVGSSHTAIGHKGRDLIKEDYIDRLAHVFRQIVEKNGGQNGGR